MMQNFLIQTCTKSGLEGLNKELNSAFHVIIVHRILTCAKSSYVHTYYHKKECFQGTSSVCEMYIVVYKQVLLPSNHFVYIENWIQRHIM